MIVLNKGSDLDTGSTLDNANSKLSSDTIIVSFNLIKLACYFLDGNWARMSFKLFENDFS